MGSGKHLKRAISKYGIENFSKEILFIFDNESDMNSKEKELVTPEFVKEDTNYNLCPGGQGGFGYINEQGLNWSTEKNKSISLFGTPEFIESNRESFKRGGKSAVLKLIKNGFNMKGVSKPTPQLNTLESIQKRSISLSNVMKGDKNHQFGKIRTEEEKRVISETMKSKGIVPPSQKGKFWWNNGIKNTLSFTSPGIDWIRGRL